MRTPRLARQSLAEAQLRSRASLLDTIEQAVIATELDGTITYWNRFAEQLYGWTADEVLGRNIEEVTPSEISRAQATEIMEHLRAGKSWAGEFEVRRRDGSCFPAHVTDTPIRDEDGQMIGVVGVSFDLTDSKRLQSELRSALTREQLARAEAAQSLALLDALVSNAPIGIVFFDREGHYLRINNQVAEINGLPAEAHIGRTVREVVPDLAEQVEAPLQHVLTTGQVVQDVLVRGQTGGAPGVVRAWRVSFYPVPAANGEITGVGAVAVEITEQQRLTAEREQLLASERELRAEAEAQRSRLHQVVDVLPEGIVIADRASQAFVLQNRAAVQLLGLDIVGANVPSGSSQAFGARQFDGTPIPADELPLQRALDGESVRGAQFVLHEVTHNRDIPILMNGEPLRDASGAIVGALVVFQDITAIRDLDEQKDEFVATVSHDLQQPLAIMKGRAQLMRRGLMRRGLEVEQIDEGLAKIQATVDDMASTLRDLLDATRLQMGRPLDLQLGSVDLVDFLQQIVSGWDDASTRHRVAFETGLEHVPARLDGQRIRRVMSNLLSNAFKYSRDDALVTVRLGVEDAHAVVDVEDHGIGIPTSDLPHVFERFYRAGNVEAASGSGIGLAAARQIVRQHGGSISVRSRVGEGSTFTVRIPLAG